MWSRKKSWHLIRYPLHTVFAILIAMAVGWAMCAILTEAGAFSMDRDHKDFYSRTDARTDIIHKSSWFNMPYPGGVLLVMFGVFNGVVLSNLQSVSLSSMRNLAIIGSSLMVGLVIPEWIETYENTIDTGNKEADNVILTLLGNPNLAGGVLACFLDNTIPGTRVERGIALWEAKEEDDPSSKFSEGYEVYNPPLFDKIKHFKMLRFLPFMPAPQEKGM